MNIAPSSQQIVYRDSVGKEIDCTGQAANALWLVASAVVSHSIARSLANR